MGLGFLLQHRWLGLIGVSTAVVHAARDFLLVSVGPRDARWERDWLEAHAAAGFHFRVLFVEPDPTHAGLLSSIAAAFGGRLVLGAAWTSTGERRVLQNAGTSSGTVMDVKDTMAPMGVNGSNLVVETVSLEDLLRAELQSMQPDPYVVMHMDCEGCEYELLRHLIVRGLGCRFQQIYVEMHAMYYPGLQHLRPVDVTLPWLLGAPGCDVDVFVDNHYFMQYVAENRWRGTDLRRWPEDDGDCATCPLLYRPLPPQVAGGAQISRSVRTNGCPASYFPPCFDQRHFTCERCCDLTKGLRGDEACWDRDEFFTALGLQSYEFCCGQMFPLAYVNNARSVALDHSGLEAAANWRDTSRLLRPMR